ncbi:MAG TPA: cupin domain-containing protein [Nevskiaceae bacterium]|nr:cupin domain-containing protein [Nevskiaceae bacterium]
MATRIHRTLKFRKGFRVALANPRAEAAEMVIPPGDQEGDAGNRHRGADQWLFVLEGTGRARVGTRRIALRAGSLLLIEKGKTHEVRNTGRALLRTLNFYVPPAYDRKGRERPAGKR